MSSRPRPSKVLTGKVRPADPFELIQWLAHCQPDARKAVAELVQNSLGAGARRVDVIRRRDKGVPCSCKGRGLCPSCGGRRMADIAASHWRPRGAPLSFPPLRPHFVGPFGGSCAWLSSESRS